MRAGAGERRGIRTVVLSVVAFIGLAGIAILVLFLSLSPPEDTGSALDGARRGAGTSSSETEGSAIAGTISIAPELRRRVSEGSTLFIIARKGPGPPFAVQRIAGPRFPLQYRLGPGDVMVAGTPFEGEVTVSVRLSRTGVAGPSERGDLEGDHPGAVTTGAHGVDIVIARVR